MTDERPLTLREHFAFSPLAEIAMPCGGTHHGSVRTILEQLDAAEKVINAARLLAMGICASDPESPDKWRYHRVREALVSYDAVVKELREVTDV